MTGRRRALLAALLIGTGLPAGVAAAPLPCCSGASGPVTRVAATPDADRQALEAARTAFRALPRQERFDLQTFLSVTGYWPAVANDSFGPKLLEAIAAFQTDLGTAATGILMPGERQALHAAASPLLDAWGLQPVRHPVTRDILWVPLGLGLKRQTTRYGLDFSTSRGDIGVQFDALAGVEPVDLYEILLRDIDPGTLQYQVVKRDFFVIAVSKGGVSRYHRFQKASGGIVGFSLAWAEGAPFHGDRLSVVMSDLFRASVELRQPRRPPAPLTGAAAAAARPEPAPDPAPAKTAPARTPGEPETGTSTGSGFYVSPGLVLTNAHVVRGCADVTAALGGRTVSGPVIARDGTNDLALVRLPGSGPAPARLRSGVRLGEDVAAFGFPLSGVLASSGNFTRGTVTATAGLGDDSRQLQISAPVQPGNSGGPLLDESGNVVGVIVAKLNALTMAAVTDDIPQNVNFAIKATIAAGFLESNGVTVLPGAPGTPLRPADLAALAQTFTVALECAR